MNALTSSAENINKLHELATSTANEAIHYAKELGEMLLEAKKLIPHGGFTRWIERNLTVSPRQAQRYMAVASGKDLKLSELTHKNDMVSVLPKEQLIEKYYNPKWIPELGYEHFAVYKLSLFFVTPYINNKNFFHISQLYTLEDYSLQDMNGEDEDYESFYSGSRLPVHHLSVDLSLHFYGLDEPEKIHWEEWPSNSIGMF